MLPYATTELRLKLTDSKSVQIRKLQQEIGLEAYQTLQKLLLRDHVKSILTTAKADSNLIRRIGSPQYVVSTGQNTYSYGASHIDNSIPRKEKDPRSFTLPSYINNVCFDNALADLGASVSVMPLLTYLNLGLGELAHTKLTVELANRIVKYPKGIAENVLVGIDKFVFPVDFIILDMPEDIKVPLILGRPFLSTAHAKIYVFKRKITLRVGEERIIFKSVKPASSLIKRVYMLSLRERMELDLEARLMGETLVLNRSLDPLNGDYIELNDLKVPLELRRDQVDDLMATIEEGEVIDEPMIDIIKTRNNKSFDEYPSFCDFDRKIHIDCAYNLRFSCMIGFDHGVLGGDTGNGSTYSLNTGPSVLGGDTCDGYIYKSTSQLHELLRERMELDIEARLMGETLVLNRSLNPLNGDYIELNDLKVPLELRRDQVDDLIPTIKKGKVIEEVITRKDDLDTRINDYPSCCDYHKKIRIDCAHNLKFSCMIDFAVLKDMDAYRDKGMGDVIFGELFLREIGIKARRFDGMITIYNGNEMQLTKWCDHIRGLNTTLMNNATRSDHY
ncbi:retrovirus-related pol polyprotein from transposon TNT 1-94 [Tanacetum coccineum]